MLWGDMGVGGGPEAEGRGEPLPSSTCGSPPPTPRATTPPATLAEGNATFGPRPGIMEPSCRTQAKWLSLVTCPLCSHRLSVNPCVGEEGGHRAPSWLRDPRPLPGPDHSCPPREQTSPSGGLSVWLEPSPVGDSQSARAAEDACLPRPTSPLGPALHGHTCLRRE